MPHNNPWYLITGDEICRIRKNLQMVRDHIPEQEQQTVEGTLTLLHEVQVRRP